MGDVVTFYSYKGGAGRTFLMANVAAQLSKWGYKVLCIDWDLEAPGLHYYFRSWLSKLPEYGLLELIEASLTNKDVGWDKYTTSLRLPRADSRLSFIFAGAQDESYKSRVQGLDWSTLYSKGFGNFLERLRSEWKELYDFVLIDSRTGITDIGGICTVQLPDILAFVFTANAQSIEGAVDVVHRAVESRRKLLFDRARFIAIPVLSRFDDREEKKLSEEWMADIENKVAPVVSAWRHQSVRTGELLYRLMVPYFSFWSFGEGLPVVTDARSDQGSINYNFQTIASVIAHRGNGTNNLVLARDTYVISASERVQPQEAALMLALDERQISSRRADLKAHGDLELFKVTTPTKEELRYRYHVLASGLSYVGYLTYELPARSYERTIIMVNGSALVGKLSEWQRNEYSRLVEFVSEAAGGSTGIKNIVNRLAEKEFANLPNVSIAVHKFGPVPVYLLPESYIVKPFGEDVEVQIGLYPAVKPRRRAGGRVPFPSLPFLATKSEFVRSLNVGLGLMFQR